MDSGIEVHSNDAVSSTLKLKNEVRACCDSWPFQLSQTQRPIMERGNLSHCTGGAVCRVTAPDRPPRGITRSFPASLLDTSDYTV